jgi:branched-chain amino acid transport system permease protein
MSVAASSAPTGFFTRALKESAIAAAVTAVLALPLLGFRTVQEIGGLTLNYRWSWIAYAAAAVFVGRFLVALYRARPRVRKEVDEEKSIGAVVNSLAIYIVPAAVLFAVALPFMPFSSRYVLDIAILVLTYIMLGWGLNIVVGLAGLLDLGYVAFYAVGAYSYALFALHFDLGFWICLPLAGILAATFGCVLGFPVLRLRGDYLAIVTLGFGEIIRIVLINWYDLTKGPDGLSGIPRPTFFGLPFTRRPEEGVETFHQFFDIPFSPIHRIIFLYYVILALALLTNAFTMRIRRLPIGRAWEALREDEIACRSLGINPVNTKLTAFSIGAMFGGFAGSFFATRQGFISPESFTFIESAIIVAIVVLGGLGSQIGVVIAALFLIGLPELLRELELFRMLALGGLMVIVMVWRPSGLLSHREPTIRLFDSGRRRLFGGRKREEAAQ